MIIHFISTSMLSAIPLIWDSVRFSRPPMRTTCISMFWIPLSTTSRRDYTTNLVAASSDNSSAHCFYMNSHTYLLLLPRAWAFHSMHAPDGSLSNKRGSLLLSNPHIRVPKDRNKYSWDGLDNITCSKKLLMTMLRNRVIFSINISEILECRIYNV